MIRKRLLGIDKAPLNLSSFDSNSMIVKMFKALGPNTSEDDLQIVIDYEEEQTRKGNFDLIFPLSSNASYYK